MKELQLPNFHDEPLISIASAAVTFPVNRCKHITIYVRP